MEIIINRTYKENATYGEGQVYDTENHDVAFEFCTLEPLACVPEGVYLVEKMKPTAKRNYVYFRVMDVPGRDTILFQPEASQIPDWILPGEEFKDLDLTNTTATLKILTALMSDKFKLTIKKA